MAPMDTNTQAQLESLLARLKQGEVYLVPQIVAAFNARQAQRTDGAVMVRGWEAIVTSPAAPLHTPL